MITANQTKGVKNDDAHVRPTGVSQHHCPSRVYRDNVVDAARSAARGDIKAKPRISRPAALHFINDRDRFDGRQLFSRLSLMVKAASVSVWRRVMPYYSLFSCFSESVFIFCFCRFFLCMFTSDLATITVKGRK